MGNNYYNNNQGNENGQVKIFSSRDTNQLEQNVNDFILYCGKCRHKIISIEMQTMIQDGNELMCCLVHYSTEAAFNMQPKDSQMS